MAEFTAGVCPRCKDHLLLKTGTVFLVCPLCGDNISMREAVSELELNYSDPSKLTQNIAEVIKLEKKYGPQLPYQILLTLKKNFPHNEEIAYLTLKMSGYNSFILKDYLLNFAKFQKPVSFATEVLQNGLIEKNWELSHLFEQYINNKTSGKTRERFIEKLREINASIQANPPDTMSNTLIYIFYIVCGILNIALAGTFIIFNFSFIASVFITVTLLCTEMSILYIHAKNFGGRLTISEVERILMVAFMCTLVIAVGGVFLGALFEI